MKTEDLDKLFCRPAVDEGAALEDLCDLVLQWRRAKSECLAALKEVSARLDAVENLLLTKLAEAGLSSVKKSGRTFTAVRQTSYDIVQEALTDHRVRNWLVAMGGSDLLHYVLDRHAFSAFCRKLYDAGRHVHPKVRTVERTFIRITSEESSCPDKTD